MGLTFAKSVKFGPVRFNFSGSGIGVSAGIPGLRIGTGPRGAYIAGGAGGFRYRKSLGRGNARSTRAQFASTTFGPVSVPTAPGGPVGYEPNVTSVAHHDTKQVLSLGDSSDNALLQSMNEQRSKPAYWVIISATMLVALVILYVLTPRWPIYAHLSLAAALLGVALWLRWRDKVSRLTVLFFDPDEAASKQFESLVDGLRAAAGIRKVKAVASTSNYRDTRYSAGATQGLKFQEAGIYLGQAPGVLANLDIPILQTGRTTLAFYPDRILAFRDRAVGAIGYGELRVENTTTRFIEHEALPVDAKVVGHTWQYVNKGGGPDRRFKNNRQIPVCLYNEFNLSTLSGLDVRFLGSKHGGFDGLAAALKGTQPQA